MALAGQGGPNGALTVWIDGRGQPGPGNSKGWGAHSPALALSPHAEQAQSTSRPRLLSTLARGQHTLGRGLLENLDDDRHQLGKDACQHARGQAQGLSLLE